MDRESLKQYLSKPYQGPESFLENIIFPVFGEESFGDAYETELLDSNPELRPLADATGIESVKQIGTIYFEEPIQIFDITVSDRILMQRNRVGIQQLIRRAMDTYSFSFMLFHYNDRKRWDWRFTFCHKLGNNDEGTDRKRYTFLLGPGQSCRTAADNFLEMFSKRNTLAMRDIEHAFSVEVLSNEFFGKYKKQYEDILLYITGKKYVKKNNKWVEEKMGKSCMEIMQQFSIFLDSEKAVRDYVKKLMGRIVFLFFLQKKGWLGVPKDKQWGEGDQEFIQHLFEQCKDKDHFVDNVLETLFNDLNTERDGDISKLSMPNSKQFKVPYLNGGLFEPDAADKLSFPLPAKFLQTFIRFLAEYNFTIDENDPDDAEVGVDPEMLGRIFENLLEDNKDKGAFYTPKEIVTYMCRESLIAYLQTDIEKEEQKEAIRQFVTTHKFVEHLPADIPQMLKDVKICDPAIGSGAFPMGLLKELFLCRTALECIKQNKAAEIKKHIIQQNIYGVDIEKGAVDIARLRFWLSLIVDEETPQALPNLDFKIMQGNSLLEQYEGYDLSTVTEKKDDGNLTLFDNMLDVYRKELRDKLSQYYQCTESKAKKRLKKEIVENVKKQLLEIGIEMEEGDPDLSGNNQFFLWHTWFYDVFSKGGFDIVIGNPPYIQLQANEGLLASIYEDKNFETFNRSGDIFSLFYEVGWHLLKKEGHLCYITSNKWMRNDSGKETREFLALKTNPIIIFDFAGLQLFENATVETNIILFSKEDNDNNTLAITTDDKSKDVLKNLEQFASDNGSRVSFVDSDDWIILSAKEAAIQKKITKIAKPLKEWNVEINFGIKTGYNTAFIIDNNTRKKILNDCESVKEKQLTESIIVPVIRGRDVMRYMFKWADLWLINTHNGIRGNLSPIDISLLPSLKKYLNQYLLELSTRSDKGITPYNLRNCAYLKEFSKPKIIWGEISDRSKFSYDEDGKYFCEATTFFMTGEISAFLLCYLNSRLSEYLFSKIATRTGMGTTRWKKYKIERLPIPCVSQGIKNKVEKLYNLYKQTINEKWLNEIDLIVYHLYDLTYDEVLVIDPNPPFSREEYEADSQQEENIKRRVLPRTMPLLEEEDDFLDEDENDDVESDSDEESEWHFVESVPFTKSSKYFLSHDCRVVLSELGYYLEVDDEYIRLGDYQDGFSSDQGNVWVKKPKDKRGYQMIHEVQNRTYLIGYIREEEDIITYTNPDGEEYTITFS